MNLVEWDKKALNKSSEKKQLCNKFDKIVWELKMCLTTQLTRRFVGDYYQQNVSVQGNSPDLTWPYAKNLGVTWHSTLRTIGARHHLYNLKCKAERRCAPLNVTEVISYCLCRRFFVIN